MTSVSSTDITLLMMMLFLCVRWIFFLSCVCVSCFLEEEGTDSTEKSQTDDHGPPVSLVSGHDCDSRQDYLKLVLKMQLQHLVGVDHCLSLESLDDLASCSFLCRVLKRKAKYHQTRV